MCDETDHDFEVILRHELELVRRLRHDDIFASVQS